jgi:L-ribulose-5-phosphate 4-epimerase
MSGDLREAVAEANRALAAAGLVRLSFGNVSGVDRLAGVVMIKPSGIPCGAVSAGDVALVSLESGEHLDGLKPSSDTATHLGLYRAFPSISGVAHSHSSWATIWAQALRPIPCLGTTHADSFPTEVPLTRPVTADEINGDYEGATGDAIVEAMSELDPLAVPGVLVASHGPFVWGIDPADAVENAAALEQIALIAYHTVVLNPDVSPLEPALHSKHFLRKHGPTAYYGQ